MDGGLRGGSLDQLAGKRRTYEDLSRFVGARASGAANYSLLLGAGCSISSNIRSASQLVDQWRREVFMRLCPDKEYSPEVAIDYLGKNCAVWYNPQREYSSLFEKGFDLPRQRRMFVEQEVAGKNPNLGYAYLVRLIEEGFLNTVFTTNFDDLVNEAFFQFSQTRPIVCAHDSAISSVSVTSKRPKVIKLHGDYLFDDIKATVRETESLEDNIRKKFIEFCRDFGLIVVGYGGGDRSIMDVLQYLLRSDDYFKHGIYWCIRRGDQPSDELLKLLWRDRVYFIEVDGFDELMAALHGDLVGAALPIDTGVVTNKPREIMRGFCDNSFLNDSPSSIIKRDLERLRKQSEREELFRVLRGVKDEASDREASSSESLSDKEIVVVFEVKQSLVAGDLDAARSRIKAELERRPSRRLNEELSNLRVRVEELAGDLAAALSVVDSLILEDPREPENYIRKISFVVDHEERIRILDSAQAVDSENARVYFSYAECYVDYYMSGMAADRQAILEKIDQFFEKSLVFDPSLRNPAWNAAAAFYADSRISKNQFAERLDSLSARCSKLGATRTVSLRTRLTRWSQYKEDRSSQNADILLKDVSDARLASSKSMQQYYEWLELDAYWKLERKEDLSRRLGELALNPDLAGTREYLNRKSDFLLKFNGDIHGAISALRQAIEVDSTRADVVEVVYLMELIEDAAGIVEVSSKHGGWLELIDKISLKRSECVARRDHEGALALLRSSFTKKAITSSDRLEEVHDLLLLTRYSEAAAIGKALLDRVAWNKSEYGEHIINYELSQLRQNLPISKKRLGELVDVASADLVRGCANYLLGDTGKAKEIFVSALRENKRNKYTVPRWAIFGDPKGKVFIDEVVAVV